MSAVGALLAFGAVTLTSASGAPPTASRTATQEIAARAAIHPVATPSQMRAWLTRVPATRAFPPDFDDTLRSHAQLLVIEMATTPNCVPCADLWSKLSAFRARYGWQVRTIDSNEAMLRSGRLGLPWVGNPIAWVRPINDDNRMIPIAIGTDHPVNVARNAYLASKMLTGVRAAVAVRAMSKFTGIVGAERPAHDARSGRPRA